MIMQIFENIFKETIFLEMKIAFLINNILSFLLKSFLISKSSNKKRIIGFLPKSSAGWILEYIFRDIKEASESKKHHYILCKDIYSLFINTLNADYQIISLHPDYLKFLLLLGFDPKRVSTISTHQRNCKIRNIFFKVINKILIINSYEANSLLMKDVPKQKLQIFPIGYSSKLFRYMPKSDDSKYREIDVLFVCRYLDRKSSNYYWIRKNYQLLIAIAKSLASKNYKVCILGKNWLSQKEFSNQKNITFMDVNYKSYPKIYQNSKIYVSPSKQEGGPTSWLEAMASGCYVVSTLTGFSMELSDGEMYSWKIPFNRKEDDWSNFIDEILKNHRNLTKDELLIRQKFLKPSSFQDQAKVLEKISDNKLKDPSTFWTF